MVYLRRQSVSKDRFADVHMATLQFNNRTAKNLLE